MWCEHHHLVVSTLRLKLKKYHTRNPKVTPRYNTKLLQDPGTIKAFQIALSNRYQILLDLVDEDPKDYRRFIEGAKAGMARYI